MKFHEHRFPGVYLIEPESSVDNRGLFRRHFCEEEFHKAGISFVVRQANFSENTTKHTLRGIHYRQDSVPENKMLTCVKGETYSVIVDLRIDSPTYLEWSSLTLSQENRMTIFLPHGCANAFLTLRDDTIIYYCHSSIYQPGADIGIRYDDPLLQIDWPAKPDVISNKDLSYGPLIRGQGTMIKCD